MLLHTVLLFSLFYHSFGLKNCDDCVNIEDCPAAVRLFQSSRNAETGVKFRNSICGFVGSEAKICCSDYSGNQNTEVNELDSHRNLALLPQKCGSITGDRIVGGTTAKLYEFPWMALISYFTRDGLRWLCGGSLINERYVLTAAHCIITNKEIAGVRLGELNILDKIDCQNGVCESFVQDIPVAKKITYPGYKKQLHDIGLLRLETPAELNRKNIAPICLPVTPDLRNFNVRGTDVTVAGWGATELGYLSSSLLKVVIPVFSADECYALHNSKAGNPVDDTTDKLCAGELNKDSCKGDSGGPLMSQVAVNGVERIVQYGVVSYGENKCGTAQLGTYTEVTKYLKWILDSMEP